MLFEPSEMEISDKIQLEYVESVIGSGYEEDVAKLAIEDKVAYRAARKNMQIHSAIILKIECKFTGFFTFQVNHDAKEYCLLQSAMQLDKKDKAIYSLMVAKIIELNTYGYPMIMTVSKKHDLEKPSVFKALGFETYYEVNEFEYMVYGKMSDVRLKLLAHIAMTNIWHSTKGPWLKIKKEWNEKIEQAGKKYNIPNPKYATREGCWQGSYRSSYCLDQFNRLKPFCKSVLRIVSCDFNKYNPVGLKLSKIQDQLFNNSPVIDTVFRCSKKSRWVTDGIINVTKSKFLKSTQYISKFNRKAYIGKCAPCKDQCGLFNDILRIRKNQLSLV